MRVLIFILLFLGSCSQSSANAQCDSTFRISDGVATFCGRIEYETDEVLLALLEHNQVDTLIITSGGGVVFSAINMIDALNEHSVDIIARSKCFSACVQYILALGNNVTVEPNTAIGFHQNPFATWLIMNAAGIVADPEDPYWTGSNVRFWLSALAYDRHGVDRLLLAEPELNLGIACVMNQLTRRDADGQAAHRGFRTRQSKKWWVPSLALLNSYRTGTDIKGWWPNSLDEVYATYELHDVGVEKKWIVYSNIDDALGWKALDGIEISWCADDNEQIEN